jgi:hypothetical protein
VMTTSLPTRLLAFCTPELIAVQFNQVVAGTVVVDCVVAEIADKHKGVAIRSDDVRMPASRPVVLAGR